MWKSEQDDAVGRRPERANHCPEWCVQAHGVHTGEEDWIHSSEPVPWGEGLVRLCVTVHPASGTVDGPYVVGEHGEWRLREAEGQATALLALISRARAVHVPAQTTQVRP